MGAPVVMKMSDWLEQAREFPTQAEAERYRLANGIQIEGENSVDNSDNGELPPVSGGALSTITATDEDGNVDVTDDTETPGGLDLASIDFDKFRTNPGEVLKSLFQANQAAEQRAAASSKRLYDQARQRIMEKYAGPSEADQLLALSRAMLAPRKVPGFKGFLGSVVGSLDENAQATRKAQLAREDQLFALQQQYQKAEADRLAGRPKALTDMLRTYAAAKPPASGMNYDPQRGIFVDRNNPRPTENTYDIGGGRMLVQWQDGLWREQLPNGMYKVFERAGNAFKELGTEGAR